ncbi:ATP synthase subunit delta [Gammaproteobacteria bacterium]
MSDKTTIARPYARAIFQQARRDDALEHWLEMLTLAANIVKDSMMSEILDNPLISRNQIGEMIFDMVQDRFSEGGRNLIRILAVNDRLAALPEIVTLFDQLKAEAENRLEAEITSAYPMDPAQERLLTRALEKRFGHAINIKVHVDQNLIGGVIIHIGDVVIDGSLRAGLTQMANELRI